MKPLGAMFCALAAFSWASHGQSAVSVTKLVGSALGDPAVISQKKQVDAMHRFPYRLPLINDAEIRSRNTAYDIQRMRYSIRLQPRGFGETKASDVLFKSQVRLIDQESGFSLNTAMLARYMAAIDFIEGQALLRLYTDLICVFDDRIKVLAKKTYTTDFDLNSVILAENEITKMKDQDIEERKELGILRREIGQYLGDTSFVALDTAGLIGVEAISEEVRPERVTIDTNNVYLENYRLKFQVSQNRYNLEKAQDRRYITLLSFSYDYDQYLDEIERGLNGKSSNINNSYLLEVGIRLPFITMDNREMARRKTAYLEDKADYEQALRDLDEKMRRDAEDIKALITEYRYLEARENEVDAQASLKKYMQMTGVDPLMLLSIKEGMLQNGVRKAKMRFDIMRNYIRVLDVAGKLSGKPLVNHLSAAKERVAP